MNCKVFILTLVVFALVTPAATQIDNCCFVNRQCATDQQWVDGYWAYQRNECPAAVVETAGTAGAASVVAPVSVQIDNCCFVNRQCATDQQWVDGYWAYQRNECPGMPIVGAPAVGARHAVWIDGSPPFVDFINEALDWMQVLSQSWYNYVITGADRISEDPERDIGAAARVRDRHILMSRYESLIVFPEARKNLAEVLRVLVHEACHIYRHEAGYTYNGYTQVDEEWACLQQENRLSRVLPAHYQDYHQNIFGATCSGDLTNHWRCRRWRNKCTWTDDGIYIVSCP